MFKEEVTPTYPEINGQNILISFAANRFAREIHRPHTIMSVTLAVKAFLLVRL
jgi:hypothetical protein